MALVDSDADIQSGSTGDTGDLGAAAMASLLDDHAATLHDSEGHAPIPDLIDDTYVQSKRRY